MRKLRVFAAPIILSCAAMGAGHAQVDVEFDKDKRQHASVVIAGTHIPVANETSFTIGIDYEYRVDELIGLGAVVEHAFGPIDSTTLLAVADVHLWRGFALQVGPGLEFIEDDTSVVGRIGALYEFEFAEKFTIAPQAHYDISNIEDAFVFGIAIGRAF